MSIPYLLIMAVLAVMLLFFARQKNYIYKKEK